MTALERALVVYAEAKGYEIEVETNPNIWYDKETCGLFNFSCKYRIKNKKDYRKVYDELSDFFKSLYSPEQPSKLLPGIERAKYKPAGFSYKSGMQEVSELLEANNVKITDYPGENKQKEEITGTHKFTLDMKFKEGDKVKTKSNFKDNNIYEVCGFEYFTHARGQCSGIRYQMVDSEGECGHWAREDALELYNPKQPEPIPATEEELKEINRGMICIKNKETGQFGWVMRTDPIPDEMYLVFDPVSKCWEDWSSK